MSNTHGRENFHALHHVEKQQQSKSFSFALIQRNRFSWQSYYFVCESGPPNSQLFYLMDTVWLYSRSCRKFDGKKALNSTGLECTFFNLWFSQVFQHYHIFFEIKLSATNIGWKLVIGGDRFRDTTTFFGYWGGQRFHDGPLQSGGEGSKNRRCAIKVWFFSGRCVVIKFGSESQLKKKLDPVPVSLHFFDEGNQKLAGSKIKALTLVYLRGGLRSQQKGSAAPEGTTRKFLSMFLLRFLKNEFSEICGDDFPLLFGKNHLHVRSVCH